MGFLNKNNKIEFFHPDLNAAENFPILDSRDFKLNWVKKARANFDKARGDGRTENPGFTNITRCPGIFDLLKEGYVVRSHKDLMIFPREDGFKFILPDDQQGNWFIDRPYEGTPSPKINIMANPEWEIPHPPNVYPYILKIETGWNVITPKNVKLLIIPLPYPDDFNVSQTSGILDPSHSTQINFQGYVYKTDSKLILKAGTPLLMIIPLTEKKYEMTQRLANEKDRMWIAKDYTMVGTHFWPVDYRQLTRKMYERFWIKRKQDV